MFLTKLCDLSKCSKSDASHCRAKKVRTPQRCCLWRFNILPMP